MFSIESFEQSFETEKISLKVGNRSFSFLTPKKIEELIETNMFPLWVKIWEASLVLSDYLVNRNHLSKSLLELGAGLGTIGIIAESVGYKVTTTEYDSKAIQFLHANAHINESHTLKIEHLDWHKPDLEGLFDIIVGSELIYKQSDFEPLIALFRQYLSPKGEILLANEPRKSYEPFLDILKEWYHIEIWKKSLRSIDGTKKILLTRLTGKETS